MDGDGSDRKTTEPSAKRPQLVSDVMGKPPKIFKGSDAITHDYMSELFDRQRDTLEKQWLDAKTASAETMRTILHIHEQIIEKRFVSVSGRN